MVAALTITAHLAIMYVFFNTGFLNRLSGPNTTDSDVAIVYVVIVLFAAVTASYAAVGSSSRGIIANTALEVEVTDDGHGWDGRLIPGVGIQSMRERAADLGGTLTIERMPGGGTSVRKPFLIVLIFARVGDGTRANVTSEIRLRGAMRILGPVVTVVTVGLGFAAWRI